MVIALFLTRHIQPNIQYLAQHAKVILILGARQVGKSTLLKHTFPDLPHITFDPFMDLYNQLVAYFSGFKKQIFGFSKNSIAQ